MARGKKTGGRVEGTKNKVTVVFKDIVNDILGNQSKNIVGWLQQTAEGVPAKNALGEVLENEFGVVYATKPDPKGAVQLLNSLAEYAYPKLARTDHTSSDGSMSPKETIDVSKLSDNALKELMNASDQKGNEPK